MLRVGLLMTDQGYDWDLVGKQLEGLEIERWQDCMEWDEQELVRRCRGVDAVVTGRGSPSLSAALIQDRGRLRLLAHCHGTIRHLVTKAHLQAGLLVSNWGENVFGVAEGALTLLLALLKQLSALHRFISNDWRDDQRIFQCYPCTLAGCRVGLYGFGPIGRHMGRLLQPFGGPVAIYDPYAKDLPAGFRVCATLRELFETSDAISIHCGLNDHTRNSVTAELLALLPQGGIVVNTARGPIVDEDALAAEVARGRLLAAVDVICNEHDWAHSPLCHRDGAILTGHLIGGGKGYPPGERQAHGLAGFVVANLKALAEGRDLVNLVSAEVYDLKT